MRAFTFCRYLQSESEGIYLRGYLQRAITVYFSDEVFSLRSWGHFIQQCKPQISWPSILKPSSKFSFLFAWITRLATDPHLWSLLFKPESLLDHSWGNRFCPDPQSMNSSANLVYSTVYLLPVNNSSTEGWVPKVKQNGLLYGLPLCTLYTVCCTAAVHLCKTMRILQEIKPLIFESVASLALL